jgi:glycogen debranching enzyme
MAISKRFGINLKFSETFRTSPENFPRTDPQRIVHYDSADATPPYIVLMGEYLKWPGDVDFVRSQWERVERAMDHLHSTIRNDYGFIENYNVGHGWVEFGPLAGSDVEV